MTLDPIALLSIAAITSITSINGALVSQYILSRFAQHNTIESLKAAQFASQKRDAANEIQIADLKSKQIEQQIQYDARFSQEALRAKYTFDKTTGVYLRDQSHFCPTCLLSNQTIEAQLKEEQSGWRCASCRGYFSKPKTTDG